MAPRNAITHETLEAARAKLQELKKAPPPEPETLSVRQAVQVMAADITELLGHGYTKEQIIDILRATGIDISKATFRQYLQSARSVRKRKVSTPPAKAAGTSEARDSTVAGEHKPNSPGSFRVKPDKRDL